MRDAEAVSTLIGDIYDAALDASLWPDVLGKARGFVGGRAATLVWKDAVSKSANACYLDGGLNPRYVQLYFDKYIKFDPCTTGQFFAEIEKPLTTVDFIPYDEFLETRFYKEWARPQSLVDSVMTVLDKSVTSFAMLVVFRHEDDGIVDGEARRRTRLIAPHMRRAVLIGKMIDLKTAEAATFADTLDGISAGMFLVNATAHLVHANATGHAMLNEEDFLRASGGRLVASHPKTEQALQEIFATIGGGEPIGIGGIALPLAGRRGERYVAHVLPLTSGARRRAGMTYAAVAAVFVHKATLEAPSPPETIAKTYKLTPTELRVLLAVVEVGGVPEVAEALGIAETTVKTHLSRLYVKTGTRRQAELVKVVAGFSNPLVA